MGIRYCNKYHKVCDIEFRPGMCAECFLKAVMSIVLDDEEESEGGEYPDAGMAEYLEHDRESYRMNLAKRGGYEPGHERMDYGSIGYQ